MENSTLNKLPLELLHKVWKTYFATGTFTCGHHADGTVDENSQPSLKLLRTCRFIFYDARDFVQKNLRFHSAACYFHFLDRLNDLSFVLECLPYMEVTW